MACEQPLPLQKDIITDLNITHTEYTLLLAASTFPNIFFPLLGGWVFDSLGRGYCVFYRKCEKQDEFDTVRSSNGNRTALCSSWSQLEAIQLDPFWPPR